MKKETRHKISLNVPFNHYTDILTPGTMKSGSDGVLKP
jgi:hypothetical protein